MTNEKGETIVEFTPEGRRAVIEALFPGLSEEEGIAKLSAFITYIILK